jgi:hypothetical protein
MNASSKVSSTLGLFVVASILAAVNGCSGDDPSSDAPAPAAPGGENAASNESAPGSNAAPPAAPGSFTLGAPAEVIVRAGATASFDVDVAKGAGFAGEVALEIDALPNGISAAIDGRKIMLTAAADAALGDASLVVRGKGGGAVVELSRAVVVAGKAGTVDTAFGAAGIADGFAYTTRGLGIDGQGRLYTSGLYAGPPGKGFIARYDAKGAIDKTYGKDGLTTLVPTGLIGAGYELHAFTDGSAIVSIYATDFAVAKACVTKVDANGEVVKTFGTEGFACTGEAGKTITPSRLVVLGDGSILHGGKWDGHAFVEKITSAGQRDETFGDKGFLALTADPSNLIGIDVDGQGRVVVAAAMQSGSPLVSRVWRFSGKGEPDMTFNQDETPGSAIAKYSVVDSTMNSMVVGPNNDIYLGGSLGSYAAFIALDANGKPHSGFNKVGLQNFPLYDQATVSQVAMASGELVAFGRSSESGSIRAFGAGVVLDGQLDESFADKGSSTYGAAMQDVSNAVIAHGRITFVSSKQSSAPAQIIRIWQ